MMLIEAECAYFNDLRFMYEVDLKHSSHDISSDTVSCFHDHKNLKKILSEFTHVINAENSALSLTDHHSDSVTESSSLSMYNNCADTSVIVLASCSHRQYKSAEFVHFTDDFNDMMKLDKSLLIAAIDDYLSCDFNVKK